MYALTRSMLARFFPSFFGQSCEDYMPGLYTAHLTDENGLPINENKEIESSPLDIIEALLEKNNGLVIGRLKRSFCDVEFLSENMDKLAKMGVTKFFCNFIEISDQDLLDRYYYGAAISETIRNYIQEKYGKEQRGIELTTRSELYLRTLRAARNFEIRMIGIGNPDNDDEYIARIIQQYEERIPGKSIVCSGALV